MPWEKLYKGTGSLDTLVSYSAKEAAGSTLAQCPQGNSFTVMRQFLRGGQGKRGWHLLG